GLFISALCKVQTVCFEKLACSFECDARAESSLRRPIKDNGWNIEWEDLYSYSEELHRKSLDGMVYEIYTFVSNLVQKYYNMGQV
ncbi:MAG: hypothetical protein RB288_08950, partial [Bacteroidales bacterium]|nr:hypothetical protein [Bacteroidales bacterium]